MRGLQIQIQKKWLWCNFTLQWGMELTELVWWRYTSQVIKIGLGADVNIYRGRQLCLSRLYPA